MAAWIEGMSSIEHAGLSMSAKEDNKIRTESCLSFASTRTGSSVASTEVSASDSDSSSVHSRLKVREGLGDAKDIANKAAAVNAATEGTLGEPMKVEIGIDYPNANHTQSEEDTPSLQELQMNLEDSLQKLVQRELLSAAVKEQQALWQQQQHQEQQMLWHYGYRAAFEHLAATGALPAENFEDGSALAPYMSPDMSAYGAPTPMPNFADASQWGQEQHPTTYGNSGKKDIASTKLSNAPFNESAAPFVPRWVAEKPPGQFPSPNTSVTGSGQQQSNESPDAMTNADHARTVVATKINRLGFSAEKMLKEHFAQFGTIDHVCVPHKIKRVQGAGSGPGHTHLRPSGLGFIVMATEKEAQAVLAGGAEQIVCGKPVNVRAFKQGQNHRAEDD